MNALRTVSNASRAVRLSLFLCLLALLAGLTPHAASAAPRAGQGGLGQALALMASLHTSLVRAAEPGTAPVSGGLQRTPNGRVLLGRGMLRPGALLKPNATTGSNTVPIPGAVQTFDVNNPAPAFQPLVGYRNPDGTLGNNPANPPAFQAANTLAPTNLTPIWSADETFLVFSSNRTVDGNVQADGRFHLWGISVNGGEAYQITTSSTGTGEFFPTLSANDGKLAFISDAQSPGTENLYVLNQFSYSILTSLNNTQQFVNVSQPDPAQGGIVSVTQDGPNPNGNGTPATGFDQVQRPVFSPNDDSELVFSAHSVTGTNQGHYHLYFLFTTSGGFDPNNVSLPGKVTDGPADDTDPSWSKDGQFLTFASTATSVTNQPNGQNSFGPTPPNVNGTPVVQDPNQSQSLTHTPDANGLRSIFLLGGGTRGLGFGVVPTSLITQAVNGRVGAITAAGTDNFGPAWSFLNPNQFTNPTPGFEYLAFARGASRTAPHDIYYLQAARIVNPVGQSQRSNEVATTPDPFLTPLYQINAGSLASGVGTYSADEFFTGATAPPGGVENQAGPFDTSTDPIAPAGIYNTDRTDATFSYDIPNLTAGASYTLILHFLDPSSTAPGQRLFNLFINGRQSLSNFDIYASGGAPVAPSTLNRAVLVRGNIAVPTANGNAPDIRGDTVQAGHIFLRFTQSTPAKGNPIIQGIDVFSSTLSQTGTQASPSSGFGLLVASGDQSAPSNFLAIGDVVNGNPQITLTAGLPNNNNNLGRPVSYNIFRSAGGPTSENTPNNSGGGNENTLPLYNVAPNVNGGLTFVDTNVQTGFEYFYQVTAVFQEAITPEGATQSNGSTNTVVKLNTDDNAGETAETVSQAGAPQEAAQTGNTFDDVYPAWSPGLSIFSITYSSNRTVTYNDPATSFPTETAVSVGQGGSVNTSDPNQPTYTVGANYSGIFESQVLNLDPPTLLRFSPNEIVHVQAGSANPVTGTPTKFQGLNPGRPVTFTVRLSDRESGIDNTGAFSGGPSGAQVYLQIKNPNSKYQDAQSLEHKVFAKDFTFNNQPNRSTLNDINSGTANTYLGLGFDAFEGIFNPTSGTINLPIQKWSYPPYGTPDQGAPATNHISGRGTHGGHWPFPNGNNPDDSYIFIGRNGGGVNPNAPFIGPQDSSGDPNRFIPAGPEYECQLVNPLFMTSGQPNGPSDTSPADFVDPFYLAGVDDQGAFSGVGRVRPTINGTKSDGTLAPAEWLQMTRVPAAQQDNKGGVLYTVTWTTPASASDFYLDIIAFDQAVFPNIAQGTSRYVGGSVNWRIYDNVGGFSTVQSLPSNDILVVSDYALGQKFAATTFAGRNNNLNLVPKVFGTESYVTDIDVSLLPNSVYGAFAIGKVSPGPPPTIIPPFTFVPGLSTGFIGGITPLNGLGVGSFIDRVIDDGGRRDGRPDVVSQRYAVWRILARGPVPDTVLNSYLPSRQVQPAVADALSPNPALRNLPAGTVLDAHRCVIWLSPYTGDLLTDPGALDDPGTPAQNGATVRLSTQTVLRNFVLGDGTAAHPGGGRLFITGQDIGSTLTLAGSVGNAAGGFLPDVLNATLASPGGGSRLLTSTGNRITGNPNYDSSAPPQAYPTMQGTVQGTYAPGGNNPFLVPAGGGQYPYLDTLALGSQDYNDGALDQIASRILVNGASVQGQIDTITPTNGAALGATYDNGQGALVFHDDPLRTDSSANPGMPNGGAGSRVVYAAFGLEAMTTDYVSSDAPDPGFPNIIPPVLPHNARQQILHNIVCYLRTGSVSGVITQTAGTGQGAGQGVSGVTVYLQPASGTAPPTRAAFSATTSAEGRFNISGIEPGSYTLVAYKAGFTRAVSNAGVFFTVEGDSSIGQDPNHSGATLTISPLPPGQIAGNIKDTSGNPIVGATATFTSQDKTVVKTATTRDGSQPNQPAGSYFVDNVPVTNYTAIADGPLNDQGTAEYKEASAPDAPFDTGITVQANTTTQPVNFTLAVNPITISGRVFNTNLQDNAAGGVPATVTITSPTGATATGTAAADGTYSITFTPPTAGPTVYTITAVQPGFAQATPVSVTASAGDTFSATGRNAKDVGLTPLASISGRIFDNTIGDTPAGGASTAGATVTLTDSTGNTVATTSAGADGTYTFASVPSTPTPTTYTITATKVGFATTNNTVTVTVTLGSKATSPATDIGLTPILPGALKGQVTDANGAGVGGALVTFVSADGTVTLQATADANGNYSIPSPPAVFGVFPGTYNGTATGPLNPNGHPTTTQGTAPNVTVVSQATTTANFSVTTIPPSLAGTVTDSTTKLPLKSALVTVTDTATGAVIKSVQTDASGNYSTGPLPPSGQPLSKYTVTITASLAGYATQALASQSIYDGDALTGQNFALVPAPPGSVSGQVTDVSTGAGVAGAVVTITSTDGTVTLTSAPTDANGNYVIPMNGKRTDPSGNYIASVTPPLNGNGQPEFGPAPTQAITIPADGTQTVNFVLTEILASLSGTVLDNQTGKPISGATVTLTDSTGRTVGTTQTGADGTYSFSSIPVAQAAASFSVSATVSGGYFPGALTPAPSLSLGDHLTGQNIGLDEEGVITGLVTDSSTGQPLPNVNLTVTDTNTGAAVTTTVSPLTTTPGTTIGPDGKTSNYVATFVLTPGHTYSVSATKPNYNPSAAVAVTPAPLAAGQVGRADLQLTSSIGTLGGLVSDATTGAPVGGATVTVTSTSSTGATTTVATFTTNGSASPAPDGLTQGLNYSGQVAQGAYTVTLTFGNRTPVVQKVTVVGGRFNRLDFTGANGTPAIYTFPAGLQFLSTPYDYSSLGFDAVFGILNTAPTGTPPNGNRTHVAVWNPLLGQYALDPNAPADTLRLGVGYWVFLKNPVPVTVQGLTPTTPYVPVALHPAWNQIGVPNPKGIPVASLMFDNGAGGLISFATAASSQYHVVSPTLYSYDGNAYQPVTQGSVLQPWKAYWIKVFSDATLELPTK